MIPEAYESKDPRCFNDWRRGARHSYKQVLLSFPGTTMEQYTRAVYLGVYPSQFLTAQIVAMLSTKWLALFNIDAPARIKIKT